MRDEGSRSARTTSGTQTSSSARLIGGGERLDQAHRLDLLQCAPEHRLRYRVQQALAHLGAAERGERVQARISARGEPQRDAAESLHEL